MNDYLDKVEDQLTQLAQDGAHRTLRARAGARRAAGDVPPGRVRSEVLAVAAAVAVVVAVVAIVLGSSGGGAHNPGPVTPATHTTNSSSVSSSTRATHTTTHAASSSSVPAATFPGPRGGPVPSGFAPRSFTAIGESTWWLMGDAPCSAPPCTSIVRTTDGGRTFVGIPAPRVALSTANQAGVSELRFADPLNAFAYGSEMYVSHDGGAHWHPVSIGGGVSDFAIAGGYAYAVVSGGSAVAGELMRSPVGSDAWSRLTAAGAVSGGLWVHGSDVLVQSSSGGGPGTQLLVSHDGGGSFNRFPVPSPGFPCHFEEPAAGVIWAQCPTGTESGVWRSTDAGATFQPADGHATGQGQPNSAIFSAASSSTAVVGYDQLARTGDAGASYAPVGPSGLLWEYLGFTDATHGVAVGYPQSGTPAASRLYYTTDGGQTYQQVTIH